MLIIIEVWKCSFQNKSENSSFKSVPKYILFLARLEWTSIDLSSKLSLTSGDNVNCYQCSSSYSFSDCGNNEHPGNFQNKSVSSPFNWVSRFILFLTNKKRRGRPFLEGACWRVAFWDYRQEYLVVTKDEKVSPFVKIKIIVPFLCCLLDSLTNKHCRAWSFMKKLWIDSRTCQKKRILLTARQRSNNCLQLSKEKFWRI